MRSLLRLLPYGWRRRLRTSEAGYWLRADKWMPVAATWYLLSEAKGKTAVLAAWFLR